MNAWGIAALAFVGVTALMLAIFQLLHTGYWQVGRRLKMISQETLDPRQTSRPGEQTEHIPLLPSILAHLGYYTTLERVLERAGLNWRPGEFMALALAVTFGLAVVGGLLWGPFAAATCMALAVMGGWLIIAELQRRRLRQFEAHFPDALMLIASSLRSGYGLLRSIQAIRDEMKPPLSREFGKVLDETTVGLDIHEALIHLTQRVRLPDLDIAVTAMLIHLDIGGNLAEVIENVAATVRERQRIHAEVTALTTEGRLSGAILFLLPVVMAVVLTILNPIYMAALTHTSFGHLLLLCAAMLEVIGGLVIMRMLKITF